MAGIDEASARSTLATMQARLARDPSAALGLPANATAEDLRAAFLALTKQFHPVRFGRMSIDTQKLSNEVFLALRAAHDALAKTLKRQTGPMTVPRLPAPAVAQPPAPRPVAGATAPRPLRPLGTHDSGERPVLQSPTPSSGSKIVPRTTASGPSTRPLGGAGLRPAGAPAPVAASPAAAVPAAALSEPAILDLLSRQQWDQARTALHQLAARDPSSKRVRALSAYARGREAQLDGRVDDARVELQDALDLDPELSPAKTALTELFTRRK